MKRVACVLFVLVLLSELLMACGQSKPQLGDYVWEDMNNNGIQDSNEIGLAGVKINLFTLDGIAVGATESNLNGFYGFSNLDAGDYYLIFEAPNGYRITLQNQGSDDLLDSDIDPTSGQTAVFSLDAGETTNAWDAGFSPIVGADAFSPTPTATPSEGEGEVIITADADTYIDKQYPETSFGTEENLAFSGENSIVILRFPITEIPSDAEIISAKLSIYLQPDSIIVNPPLMGIGICEEVSGNTEPSSMEGVTWNNACSSGGVVMVTKSGTGAGIRMGYREGGTGGYTAELDATELLSESRQKGYSSFSLFARLRDPLGLINGYSREGGFAPELNVRYRNPPSTGSQNGEETQNVPASIASIRGLLIGQPGIQITPGGFQVWTFLSSGYSTVKVHYLYSPGDFAIEIYQLMDTDKDFSDPSKQVFIPPNWTPELAIPSLGNYSAFAKTDGRLSGGFVTGSVVNSFEFIGTDNTSLLQAAQQLLPVAAENMPNSFNPQIPKRSDYGEIDQAIFSAYSNRVDLVNETDQPVTSFATSEEVRVRITLKSASSDYAYFASIYDSNGERIVTGWVGAENTDASAPNKELSINFGSLPWKGQYEVVIMMEPLPGSNEADIPQIAVAVLPFEIK